VLVFAVRVNWIQKSFLSRPEYKCRRERAWELPLFWILLSLAFLDAQLHWNAAAPYPFSLLGTCHKWLHLNEMTRHAYILPANVIILNKINETLALFFKFRSLRSVWSTPPAPPTLTERSNWSTDQFSWTGARNFCAFSRSLLQPTSSLGHFSCRLVLFLLAKWLSTKRTALFIYAVMLKI